MTAVTESHQIATPSHAPDSIRAVQLIDSTIFAGTERHIADLAVALKGTGVSAQIACPKNSPLHLKAVDLQLDCITAESSNFPIQMVNQLASKLRKKEIDLIHAHNGVSHLIAVLATTIAGSGQCIATQHFVSPTRLARTGLVGLLSRAAHRWVISRTSRYVAISEAVANGIQSRADCPVDRMVVIPNGVFPPRQAARTPDDVRKELKMGFDEIMILSLARLDPEKSLHTLIEAVAICSQHTAALRCVIAGEGSQRSRLQRLIDERGLTEKVTLVGHTDDAQSLIDACDIFVLPSICEPFGLVILEAMFSGKPVIASKQGGPVEIIESGKTGLLFAPGDISDLSRCIMQMLDRHCVPQISESGRLSAIQNFSADTMALKMSKVYKQVMKTQIVTQA